MKLTKMSGFRFALVKLSITGIAAITVNSGILTTRAVASGWSLNATISERMEANDNINSVANGARNAYGSTTSLGTNLSWRGRRRALNLNSKFDFKRFFGPGATDNLNTSNYSHNIDFSIKRKTTDIKFFASYSSQDTTTSELEDTGFITQFDNNQLAESYGVNVTHQVNSRLTVNWLGTLKIVDFSKSSAALTPYTDFGLTGTLTQKLNDRSVFITSFNAGYYAADDLLETTTYSYRLTGQLNTKITHKLSSHIQAGIIAEDSSKIAGLASPASSSFSLGNLYNVGLDYQLKTTKFSISASTNVTPSATGNLLRKTSIGFGINHQINNHSSFNLSASSSSSTSGTALSIAPAYSYQFTKDWSGVLGYTYRQQDTDNSTSRSNLVFLSFSRKLSLMP